jgi:hypothetical protein
MIQGEATTDALGNQWGKDYSLLLTDPHLENELKLFDPNLKLMFNQIEKQWVILEWALDHSGWNVIHRCPKNESPNWPAIKNRLFVMRSNAELRNKNPMEYFENLNRRAEAQKESMLESAADNDRAHLREDVVQWRKANREMRNQPASDAVAGYPKIASKPRGKVFLTDL